MLRILKWIRHINCLNLLVTLDINLDSEAPKANILWGGLFMSSAFHVLVDRENDNLYLNLTGIFDAPAAEQLVFTLKKNCTGISRYLLIPIL